MKKEKNSITQQQHREEERRMKLLLKTSTAQGLPDAPWRLPYNEAPALAVEAKGLDNLLGDLNGH